LPYFVLIGGVLVVSTAAILIKGTLNLGVPPLTIAAGRLLMAAAILAPLAWWKARPEIKAIDGKDWAWGLAAGICLAIHFIFWISSLAYTSVASSTVLVTTNPMFVVLASRFFFHERLPWRSWCGVLMTVSGSMLVGLSDQGSAGGSNPLLGDVLALFGALSASSYLLLGRKLRNRLTLLPYIWLVYTAAAVVMLLVAAAFGQSLFGLPPRAYLFMLCLAIGPQLLGHTSFNWALKYVSATLIAVTILGEPIGSASMAYLIFQQSLEPLQLLGGAVILSGIALTMISERKVQSTVEVVKAEGEFGP
jgi:drug/metabolite transporter (DMT)-like permease